MNLIDRVRAEIDEDERIAKAASKPPWRAANPGPPDYHEATVYDADDNPVATEAGWGRVADEDMFHMVRHDPARVLRQVAAHRMILELHSPSDESPGECATCGNFHDCGCARGNPGWPCPTVLWLADAYGIEHP